MFRRAPELADHVVVVVRDHPEYFEHLAEARIGYLWALEPIVVRGKPKSAYMIQPMAQGQGRKILDWLLCGFFGFLDAADTPTPPDAVMVVEIETWERIDDKQREALLWHELLHLAHAQTKWGEPRYTDEGRPLLQVVDHDLEEFEAVMGRFGAWHEGLVRARDLLVGA